jgi:hypothetical protein
MNKRDFLIGAVTGVAILLTLKYFVFGLNAWNGCLHPGRTEPASLIAFSEPCLTGVVKCERCSSFWSGLLS